MIAISISEPNRIVEVELADRYVKEFQKNAKYMIRKSYGTCVFYETLDFIEEYKGFIYTINNKLYDTIWINKYDELIALYVNDLNKSNDIEKSQIKMKQMTIFDIWYSNSKQYVIKLTWGDIMKGIDNLKTIDDYYEEIREVEKQLKETKSSYRKNDLMKYLFQLRTEVHDYLKFMNKK